MGPHRQGTRRSSSRRLSSFTKSPGRPTRRWRAGWTATPGPVRLGQEGRRGRLRGGRQPVPDGRGPARAQARERAAEEGEVQVHFPQRRQAAGLGDVRRARGDPPGPLRAEGPAAERARDARRGARRIDHPGQKRGARHIRCTRGVLRAEAHGRTHVDEAHGAHHARARAARRRARAPSAPRAGSAQSSGGRSKTWSSAGSAPTAPTWRGSPTSPA